MKPRTVVSRNDYKGGLRDNSIHGLNPKATPGAFKSVIPGLQHTKTLDGPRSVPKWIGSGERAPAELKNPSPPCCHRLGTAGISVSKRKESRKLKAQQLRTSRFGSSRSEQMEE
uniref:Uncharacterized protein n=1 Tax=Sphaerodactylus townsendi TaxID=933632 RepID=A0ACB8G9Q8_9SAUR